MSGKRHSTAGAVAEAALIVLGKGHSMAEKLDEKELVSFKEFMIAHSIQVDAVTQLLIEKGIITEEEFYTKLAQVQHDYETKKRSKQ